MEKNREMFFFTKKKSKYFSQLVSGFVPYYKSLFLLVSLRESEEMRLLVNGLSVRLFVCCFHLYGGRRNVIKKILRAGDDDDDGDRNKI